MINFYKKLCLTLALFGMTMFWGDDVQGAEVYIIGKPPAEFTAKDIVGFGIGSKASLNDSVAGFNDVVKIGLPSWSSALTYWNGSNRLNQEIIGVIGVNVLPTIRWPLDSTCVNSTKSSMNIGNVSSDNTGFGFPCVFPAEILYA